MRKASLFLVIIFTISALFACSDPNFDDSPDAMNKASESVLTIEVYDKAEELIATGSGFIVFDDSVVATNFHVIDGASSIKVIDGDGKSCRVKHILAYDEGNDIALLEIISGKGYKPLTYSNNKVVKGEKVVAIGSPLGITNTISTGIVSGYIKEDGIEYIQFTAPISSGSSGGALFNQQGEVIGITSASYEAGQNMNLAIPIARIMDLYDSKPTKPISLEDFYELFGAALNPDEGLEPEYITHDYMQYEEEESAFCFTFGLQDIYENDIVIDATVEMVIKNADGEQVYSGTHKVTSADYGEWYNSTEEWIAAAVYIPVSAISEGSTPYGTLYYVVTAGSVYFEYSVDVNGELPVKSSVDSFETLTFSGHGPGYIKDINLPYGTYNIILTHNGRRNFVVYLNEEMIANEVGSTSFIHQIKPGDNKYYEVGTPLKNGYFNISMADGDWTITIEIIA